MKKVIAIILALAMTLSLIPTALASAPKTDGQENKSVYVYTEEDNARIEQDVFASIEQVKLEKAAVCGGIEKMTEQDYIALIPQVIKKIEASETYAPGTLQQNGNFLVWQTKIGIPCCYDPRMEAELHNTENDPTPEEIAAAEASAKELLEQAEALKGWAGSPNIGLIQPYWESTSNYADSSFNSYSPTYKSLWQNLYEATGGQGIRYSMTNANVNNIAYTMEQCGLVAFDSHGTTDYSGYGGDYVSQANCSYLCLTTNAGVTSEDTAPQQGPYGTYYHCIKGSGYAYVSGTCIANHMNTNAPSSFLYMGICLGMATDGMEAGLRAKGVEAIWGYSQSVSFAGDIKYVKALLTYLKDGDTLAEAASKTKATYGNWDPAYSSYSYSQAVENYVAFPIVASNEDPYPGHGNVDVVQTVYSTWTLYSQFNITALSNNETWGTVSVSGRQIIANPATGYEAVGYEVLEGECEVTRNGNVFNVDASTDCTIQINFAPRVSATVHYEVPDGVSCDDFEGYVGDFIALPEPEGEPTADAYHYRFLGWVPAALTEDTETLPDYQKAGTEYVVAAPQTTFYALYKYFVAEDGVTEGKFSLVTQAPASWSGDYVITYQGTMVLGATGSAAGVAVAKDVYDLDEIGGIKDGNELYNIPDEYIYSAEPAGSGSYTLKMKNHDLWLALTSNSNNLMTAESDEADDAKWQISFADGAVKIASVKYPARSLQFNDKANCFRCYASVQKPISLYSAGNGTTWFTTNPRNRVECDEHVFGEWVTMTEPTCTAEGTEKRVCTVCGFAEYNTLDALGHDYVDVVTAPGCTAGGFTTHTCSRCGDSYTDTETDPLGHDYVGVVTAPGCTAGGFTTYTCSRCGDSYVGDETDPLGHDYVGVVTAPGCTAGGFTTYTCSRCGDSYTDTETDPLGHDWGEPEYTWTETENGWDCTAKVVCGRNPDHEEHETVSAVWAELTAPDYTTPGAGTWTAVFTNERFAEQVKEVEIDHLETIVITFLPGEIDGVPVPGDPVVIRSDDASNWAETAENGKFYLAEGVWFCCPDCYYEAPEGYCFLGWKSDGSELLMRESYPIEAENLTFTAMWAPEYHISYASLEDLGEWYGAATYTDVAEGQRIGLVVALNADAWDAGYRLEKVTVADPEGNVLIEITKTVTGFEFLQYEAAFNSGVRVYPFSFIMPASDIIVTACFQEPASSHDCAISQFEDVMEAYPFGTPEHEAIEWAVTNKYASGMNATSFGVGKTLTRAQTAVFLYAAAGKPAFDETNAPKTFTDVPAGKWYTKAVLWAAAEGLVSGYSDGSFKPNGKLTRGQIMVILYAQADKPSVEGLENPYSDVPAGKWFTDSALWAYHAGIERGADGKYVQSTPCTRDAFVLYLYRIMTGNCLLTDE